MSHPGGAIFTHTADTEYGGVLRIRLYDRATIKRGCSTTRVVPVGVTFARRGDEKERGRRNGEKRGKGRERGEIRIRERPRTTLLFSRCYDIGGRS